MGMKGGERKRESEGKRTRERGIAREKRMNGRGGGEYVRHAGSPGVHSVTEAFLT